LKSFGNLVSLVNKGIILHKDAIVLKDRKKIFGQNLQVYFNYNAPSLRVLVFLYNHQITPYLKAERGLKHLCLSFKYLSLDCLYFKSFTCKR
jgi:hypothetical protein